MSSLAYSMYSEAYQGDHFRWHFVTSMECVVSFLQNEEFEHFAHKLRSKDEEGLKVSPYIGFSFGLPLVWSLVSRLMSGHSGWTIPLGMESGVKTNVRP